MKTFQQLMEDLQNNIGWARTGLAVDVADPWFRREMEAELEARNIRYVATYSPKKRRYIYAIVKGSKPALMDFVNWFKTHEGWRFYTIRHMVFKTKIIVFIIL